MGVIGGTLGYGLLKSISSGEPASRMDGSAYVGGRKLETLLGHGFWQDIEGQVVIDFGCGPGDDAIEMARRGAARVIGIDIQEHFLAQAREHAVRAGVDDRCWFARTSDEPADVIVSVDSFEHFRDPAAILNAMRSMLKADGRVRLSFGPTWYHPLGGHLFSIFPWAHLLFTEKALLRWRSDFKTDGATRFCEVAGGLNQMTIRRFRRLVAESPFRLVEFEAVPIRRLARLANQWTEEFTTSIVRGVLTPKTNY